MQTTLRNPAQHAFLFDRFRSVPQRDDEARGATEHGAMSAATRTPADERAYRPRLHTNVQTIL
ncbi:hypothetical protein [Burkholderia vietnamiensis]|uniref:hypothetical protein n=1 Tax=Burkholderia vietnamiensis TaxID=60552 RepID=UPI00076CB9DD|nr:hypothetical protein [Burkholderia vietnamiensis]KVF01112.1 hypothetical protein WJ03_08010 [Burkholderia vietnamiensis]HDR9200941.1 hypothetical protein [Burkholderia vietnamiensis]